MTDQELERITGDELRRLDARVAVELMGWTWEEVEACLWCEVGSISDCVKRTRDLPNYSEDIAAAWEVIKKLREAGWCCNITTTGERSVVHFYVPGKVSTPRTGGPTAPRAICEAARATGKLSLS